MNKLLTCMTILLLVSCSPQKDEETSKPYNPIGKYVYRDDDNIHHIDSHCLRLRRGHDDNGHEIYAKHPMDTAGFVIVNMQYFRVCSHCVDDVAYEHLLRISERNQQEEPEEMDWQTNM